MAKCLKMLKWTGFHWGMPFLMLFLPTQIPATWRLKLKLKDQTSCFFTAPTKKCERYFLNVCVLHNYLARESSWNKLRNMFELTIWKTSRRVYPAVARDRRSSDAGTNCSSAETTFALGASGELQSLEVRTWHAWCSYVSFLQILRQRRYGWVGLTSPTNDI